MTPCPRQPVQRVDNYLSNKSLIPWCRGGALCPRPTLEVEETAISAPQHPLPPPCPAVAGTRPGRSWATSCCHMVGIIDEGPALHCRLQPASLETLYFPFNYSPYSPLHSPTRTAHPGCPRPTWLPPLLFPWSFFPLCLRCTKSAGGGCREGGGNGILDGLGKEGLPASTFAALE